MDNDANSAAESSSAATMEVPAANSPAYAEWRQTGKLPEPKPNEESTPSQDSSAAGEESQAENTAPAPEAGKEKQETQQQAPKQKPRSNAETRLTELLEDLKRAGLSPAELKTFRREQAAQASQQSQQQPKATPEQTEKPAALEAPKKPDFKDYQDKSFEEWEAAKDEYFEKLADYKSAKALEQFQLQQREQQTQQEVAKQLADARKRYADADSIIAPAAQAIFADQQIHPALKSMVEQSPYLVDLLYVLGSKPQDFAQFVENAKTNPRAALQQLFEVEALVRQELGKASNGAAEVQPRDAQGRFAPEAEKAAAAPEKKTTGAPPPPKEVGGRTSAPPDAMEAAVNTGDFARYREEANRRELQARKG